jgi:hypothetical protein
MDTALRDHLARALGWAEAHMSVDDAVADLAEPCAGAWRPACPIPRGNCSSTSA